MQVTYWKLGHPELDPLLPSFKLTRFKPMDLDQQFSTKQRWKQMHGLLDRAARLPQGIPGAGCGPQEVLRALREVPGEPDDGE